MAIRRRAFLAGLASVSATAALGQSLVDALAADHPQPARELPEPFSSGIEHVVFRPRQMTAAELAQGYAWLYRRLFSHASIWRRRPADWRAVAPYLAMSYLYKRSNRFCTS